MTKEHAIANCIENMEKIIKMFKEGHLSEEEFSYMKKIFF